MKKLLSAMLALLLLAGCLLSLASCSASDWKYIEKKGKLTIGYTLFAPMDYMEGETLTGFEVEFGKAVCEILGVEAEFQIIEWDSKTTELNSKNIDCIWNGMTIDDDRKQAMGISTPYMQNNQVLVVKAENADVYTSAEALAGKSLVAEAKSAGESTAKSEAMFAQANYTAVDTQSKALMEVASGTADACIVDYVTSIGMIGEGTSYENLKVVQKFAEEEYGIGFRKEDTELLAKVNEAIQTLANNGKLAEIAEKYGLEDLLLVKPAN